MDVSIDQKAISKDILNSRLSVDWCGDPRMDKKSDIKRMQLTLIDKFELSLEKINELKICSTTPQEACINGWNISSIAFNKAYNHEGLIEHWKHK